MNPKIFLISSPSGGGGDSVIDGLEKYLKFSRVITTVTRPIRAREKQGKPYYFITKKKFKKLLRENAFIEWARVYGDYRGCAKKEISRLLKKRVPIVWKVDWQGVKTIKKMYPWAISIFLKPKSYKTLEKRLKKRGRDSLEEIRKRKQYTKNWLLKKRLYDYAAENREGKLKETINKVLKIIKKSQTRQSTKSKARIKK